MPVSPLRGDPPTGEPDAGEPPVRFGGRGKQTQLFLPTPIRTASPCVSVTPCFAVPSVTLVLDWSVRPDEDLSHGISGGGGVSPEPRAVRPLAQSSPPST